MKNIIPYKLFTDKWKLSINETVESSDFDEVFQTIKEILLDIEDMGIPIYFAKNVIFSNPHIDLRIPMNDTKYYTIVLTNEIMEVIERIKDYLVSNNYSFIIIIDEPKYYRRTLVYGGHQLKLSNTIEYFKELIGKNVRITGFL